MQAIAPISKKFLDDYKVILLDMNSTFMFGEDRFAESEDFFATYQRLGGNRLTRVAVDAAIRNCYHGMCADYMDAGKIDDFPALAEGLHRYGACEESDIPPLEMVFTQHELGHIPAEYAACLQRLSRSHRLGVVSNIWAKKSSWLTEFSRVGIADIWHTKVFSSDSRSMKPSPRLFQEAVGCFDVPLSDIVFVGDSLRVDVEPAKLFGLATVWIDSSALEHPMADCVVRSLLELETLGV
ncbi:MAG: HAD family hydrolase [Pseudomonadota bacterium]